MTTPNIEELIARLGALANTEANELADALNEAADLLQSQAKRLEELEEELAGRTDYALSLRRRLTTARMEVHTLRAQLDAIAATEPVAEVNSLINAALLEPTPIGTKLFTHPMSAQDVTELVEALELVEESMGAFVSDHGWSQRDMDNFDTVCAALSKYKGAK